MTTVESLRTTPCNRCSSAKRPDGDSAGRWKTTACSITKAPAALRPGPIPKRASLAYSSVRFKTPARSTHFRLGFAIRFVLHFVHAVPDDEASATALAD